MTTTWIPNVSRALREQKTTGSVFSQTRYKNPKQNTNNRIQQFVEKIHLEQVGVIPGIRG